MKEELLQFSYDKLIHSADFSQNIRKYKIEVDLLEVRRYFMACKPIKGIMLYFNGDDVRDGTLSIQGNQFVLSDTSLTCDAFQAYARYPVLSGMAYLITCGEEAKRSMEQVEMNYHFIQNICVDLVRNIMLQNFRTMTRQEQYEISDIYYSKAFGPGYYGMALQEGKNIHKLLKGDRLGVMYQGDMMCPLKSTIGVSFSYQADREVKMNPCLFCQAGQKDCMYCDDFKM